MDANDAGVRPTSVLDDIQPVCTVSKSGPNMAPVGRLIYEHGYKVQEWSRENDLVLLKPNGEIVQTHIEAFCHFLGAGPKSDWKRGVWAGKAPPRYHLLAVPEFI